MQRITGPLEGCPRGGGGKRTINDLSSGAGEQGTAKRQPTHCGVCREFGHNRLTCPALRNE